MFIPLDDRTTNSIPCGDCGRSFPHITGWVQTDDRTIGAYFASCHRHQGWAVAIDGVLGLWGEGAEDKDRVTFACEFRPSGAMALDAPQTLNASPEIAGRMLTRDEALQHPLISEFWEFVDTIAISDPDVVRTLRPRPRLFGRLRRKR